MIKLSAIFLDCNLEVIDNLIKYYNVNCYPHVSKERKYKMKRGDSWCAMFISVIAHMSGFNFEYEVSVNEIVKSAKIRGDFFCDETLLRVGDLVTYNWNDDSIPDHIGLVFEIGDGWFDVIEGNKKVVNRVNNTVGVRRVISDSNNVFGYIKL